MDYRRSLTLGLVTLAALILVFSGCGDKSTGPSQSALQRTLNNVLDRYDVPGIAGAIIHSDDIETAVAGIRRLGYPGDVEPDDHFHWGSNTKAMTATIIARLVEDGLISWESTILDVFPELADSLDSHYQTVTLAQILTHRAGIQAFMTVSEFLALPDFTGTPQAQRRTFTGWLLHRPPSGTVGSYLYSNAGYGIAAAMAERVSGESWESMLQTRLFSPLGAEGGVGWPAESDSNQPWGHWEEDGVLVPHDYHDGYILPPIIDPAGDVNMAIADYARFVQLHLRGLTGDPELLSAATFTRMHTPTGDYAFGWAIMLVDGVQSSVHEGSAGTFFAIVVVQPSRDLAVAVVSNAGTDLAEQAISEAAVTMLGM